LPWLSENLNSARGLHGCWVKQGTLLRASCAALSFYIEIPELFSMGARIVGGIDISVAKGILSVSSMLKYTCSLASTSNEVAIGWRHLKLVVEFEKVHMK
jgi:hypothetical protein